MSWPEMLEYLGHPAMAGWLKQSRWKLEFLEDRGPVSESQMSRFRSPISNLQGCTIGALFRGEEPGSDPGLDTSLSKKAQVIAIF